jgi:hypothetical protein
MDTQKTREINLPFPGFYHSWYSDAIDREEEQTAEYLAEREIEEAREKVMAREAAQLTLPIADRGKIEIDETQHVSAQEFCELLFDHCDYGKVYHKVAEFYVEAFDLWAFEELGLPADSFKFSLMTSPREYNFTTDRLFAHVSNEALSTMFQRSASDDHKTLARVIRARFTSYDGFISHYSNDLEYWLAKPFDEWDYNELGTLLLAFVVLCGISQEQMREELYELTFSGNGEETEAIHAGMDWPAYEKALAELRDKKRFEIAS